jgi:hypothetical protein
MLQKTIAGSEVASLSDLSNAVELMLSNIFWQLKPQHLHIHRLNMPPTTFLYIILTMLMKV